MNMQRHSRSSSRSRGRESKSPSSGSEVDGIRVYVGELSPNCSERELEHVFKKYGPLVEVWMANVPPCFAFVVFRDREDAEEAIRDMNGRTICGKRVRVSIARPRVEARSQGPRQQRVSQTNDVQCYKCGERGHLSRNCSMNHRNQSPRRRRRSPSYERSRSRSRSKRSRSHDRSQKEDARRERNSEESSSKQSSSKHKDKNRDKDSVDTQDRRRSESTKTEDQGSNNAGASSSALEATVDAEAG